jgi:hypothetical protein
MSAVLKVNVREIVDRVRSWPADARIELAQEILSTVPERSRPRARGTLQNLLGLLRGAGSPPDDAECQRILEAELLRKHGG